MMENLFKQAFEGNPSVPVLIRKSIKRKVYKSFMASKNMPVGLKILILGQVQNIL